MPMCRCGERVHDMRERVVRETQRECCYGITATLVIDVVVRDRGTIRGGMFCLLMDGGDGWIRNLQNLFHLFSKCRNRSGSKHCRGRHRHRPRQ
jgi:hypothetical protein